MIGEIKLIRKLLEEGGEGNICFFVNVNGFVNCFVF